MRAHSQIAALPFSAIRKVSVLLSCMLLRSMAPIRVDYQPADSKTGRNGLWEGLVELFIESQAAAATEAASTTEEAAATEEACSLWEGHDKSSAGEISWKEVKSFFG
jgi:hypothetical protein